MQPGDRLVCALIEQKPVGYRFKQWPLHITIVPWFRLAAESSQIATGLKQSLVGSKAFRATVGKKDQFGYKKRKQVNLVVAPELMRLEGQTRRFLHSHKAWVVDEADKTRRSFRPHITAQSDEQAHEGDSFRCDRVYVVVQRGEYKEIENEIVLNQYPDL